MVDVTNAQQILLVIRREDLFSSDTKESHKEYKLLSKMWHPDVCSNPKATEVFNHLTKLYKNQRIEAKNIVTFYEQQGKPIDVQYFKTDIFEMGSVYIGNGSVDFSFSKDWIDAFKRCKKNISIVSNGIRASPNIKDMESEAIPKVKQAFLDKTSGFGILRFDVGEGYYRLSDVNRAYGSIDSKHVAWMISRLCNIMCVLYSAGYSHNGITLDNIFICPELHKVRLIGGWSYATKIGSKLESVSAEIFKIMPQFVKNTKEASIETDIESIKAIGRFLTKGQNIPSPYKDWLWSANEQTPYKEFENWDRTIEQSFGKRKFIKMDVDEQLIFN